MMTNIITSAVKHYIYAILISAAVLTCLGGCSVQKRTDNRAQVALSDKTVALVTYNVRNLFDTFDNPYTLDEGTAAKPLGERASLAATIRQLDADVLVMQEIEAGGALRSFFEGELRDAKYGYIVDSPTDDPRGISIGAVSRLPVVRITSHRYADLGNVHPTATTQPAQQRFSRDLLRVDVQLTPKATLVIYGLHLKSKRDAEGDPKGAAWRLAEAKKAAAIIREQMAREGLQYVIVCGDLNDTPDSPAVAALMAATDPPMVDTLKETTPRVTFRNSRFVESIDFILLSPAAAKLWDGKPAQILDDANARAASDHRPVKVRLRVPAE